MKALYVLAFFLGFSALGKEVPYLTGRVVDEASLFSKDDQASIENNLTELESATGVQMAVLTVPTLDGESIEGYSIKVVESWKLGKKGKDNGVLLLMAMQDRQIRLEAGYGLEGVIPDAVAGRIIRQILVPEFRAGRFREGVLNSISTVQSLVRGEEVSLDKRERSGLGGKEAVGIFFLLLFLIPVIILDRFFRIFRRGGRSRHWGGVGVPSVGGGFGSSWGGSGGGIFSGGGGGFGGGGASGRW